MDYDLLHQETTYITKKRTGYASLRERDFTIADLLRLEICPHRLWCETIIKTCSLMDGAVYHPLLLHQKSEA